MNVNQVRSIQGRLRVPGDKSISHRAVMFGALANGKTVISNFLQGADCLSTISCFQKLGIHIEEDTKLGRMTIHGKGLHGLSAPSELLNVGNSGTTLRLISGILSGQRFDTQLSGDASIQKRPMNRIMTPLRMMGADITSLSDNGCAPIMIHGSQQLHGISYLSPIASAQVKSSILLAGLYADSDTNVTEPYVSRNHTELMLRQFGVTVRNQGTTVTISPNQELSGCEIDVPGDISSAAYFIVAALLLSDSEIVIEHVGVNPTRDGILEVLSAMGADITMENLRNTEGEAICDLRVRSSHLIGTTIGGSVIPRLIDEIPIIAVAACFAEGTTVIKDASELKVKESNRLDVMVTELTKMGADITATEDGMIIKGKSTGKLHGAVIDSRDDHRIAMSFAIAGLLSEGTTTIQRADCVNISYPTFYEDLKKLVK